MFRKLFLFVVVVLIVTFAVFGYIIIFFPPQHAVTMVTIVTGESVERIAHDLQNNKVITSSLLFGAIIKATEKDTSILPGQYLFNSKENMFSIISRISSGNFGMEQRKVTLPEGISNEQIATLIQKEYPDFNVEAFLIEAKDKQGFLYPNTYNFESTSTDYVIKTLSEEFDVKTVSLKKEASALGKNWRDVIIIASLLEEEANTLKDFALVAGILETRLGVGMALQLDAAPITYKEKGLPTAPLSNPGYEAIKAALHPESSDYVYYLTDKQGIMHYAKTYDEHKKNIKKYL